MPYLSDLDQEQLSCAPPGCRPATRDGRDENHRSFDVEDFYEYWPRLAAPALLLWGGASPAVSAEAAAEAAAANPRAEIECLPVAGHCCPGTSLSGSSGQSGDS